MSVKQIMRSNGIVKIKDGVIDGMYPAYYGENGTAGMNIFICKTVQTTYDSHAIV